MKVKKIILATKNLNKVKEFKEIFSEYDYEVLSLLDLSYPFLIDENGDSFSSNSYIKAKAIYDYYKLPVIADDSGLSVDALDGLPGIYSHRFSGRSASDIDNTHKVISMLKDMGLTESNAHFTCAITYMDSEKTITKEGYIYGKVILAPKGSNGFGYDPIFYLDEYKKTLAELPESIKNKISHRYNALLKLKEVLK